MGDRTGFHYYDDQEHYTAADLETWLPRLEALRASWLVLRSSLERMVPEFFIAELLAAGVEPVIRIPGHPIGVPDLDSLRQMFTAYRRWGVRFVVLFEAPNSRAAWTSADWARPTLVERFLDCLLPALNAMSAAEMTPVIPPLTAGGDYWDTAFLDSLLASMIRRGYDDTLREMVVGIYHFTGNRPLDWGRGGPEAWPAAQPYLAPPGTQDQRGFHRHEWIDTIVRRRVEASLRQLVVAGGAVLGARDLPDRPPIDALTHAAYNVEIVRRMDAAQIPSYVLNTAFWLLAAAPGSASAGEAWWPPDGAEPLPVVARLAGQLDATVCDSPAAWEPVAAQADADANGDTPDKPLEHYVLLPALNGAAEEAAKGYWDALGEYARAFQPVCGFSPHEAIYARRVTLVGDEQNIPAAVEADLRVAGCIVRRVDAADSEAAAEALRAMAEAGEPYGPPTTWSAHA